ncbi:MAG: class I SAM-dependent methyltransferase [Gemmatimonadetes bacterium]|nr:class I SAM-dependent methyltransferase [Gemmatimonadota bacterium]
MKALPEEDVELTRQRYRQRYEDHGYSPRTLGWNKDRQAIRFQSLSSLFDLKDASVLDIGCGFADLYTFLKDNDQAPADYLGIDLVPELTEEAIRRLAGEPISVRCGDFLAEDIPPVDFAFASGVFNHRFAQGDNEAFIEAVMRKAARVCRQGFAFDFLSDRVDRRLEHTFHSSPERILEIALNLSRRVVLRNDYLPFEFSIHVFLEDGFDPERAVFRKPQERSTR